MRKPHRVEERTAQRCDGDVLRVHQHQALEEGGLHSHGLRKGGGWGETERSGVSTRLCTAPPRAHASARCTHDVRRSSRVFPAVGRARDPLQGVERPPLRLHARLVRGELWSQLGRQFLKLCRESVPVQLSHFNVRDKQHNGEGLARCLRFSPSIRDPRVIRSCRPRAKSA